MKPQEAKGEGFNAVHDCHSCSAYAILMGQKTWAIWEVVKKYNLRLHRASSLWKYICRYRLYFFPGCQSCMFVFSPKQDMRWLRTKENQG